MSQRLPHDVQLRALAGLVDKRMSERMHARAGHAGLLRIFLDNPLGSGSNSFWADASTTRWALDSNSFWADAGDTTPQMAYAVAINPATCVVQVMRGTPPVDQSDPAGGTSESDEEAVEAAIDGGGVSIAASGSRLVTFTTWWEDRFHADVHKARNAVRIYYSGSTITEGYCRASRWWLYETGWHKDYSDSSCIRTSTPATHGSQYVQYHNTWFCSGGDTSARYNRNNAYATPWGTSGWIDDTYVFGACTSLLHYHTLFEPGVYY